MKSNIGIAERGARISLGLFIILYGLLTNTWWEALGFISLLTGIAGWSPIYAALGFSTEKSFHWTRIHGKSKQA